MESNDITHNERKQLFRHLGCLVLVLFGFVIASLILAQTAVAETSGDYTYETSGSPTVATVTGYTGEQEAVAIPSTMDGYSVVAIGDSAFARLSSITSVTIPEGVISIGDNAFYFCSSLTSVTIPNSVTSIGVGAFGYCYSLASVTIPNSVTSIGGGAFAKCDSLASIIIPDKVTSIGSSTFVSCHSLASVTIPNSVTSIEDSAFGECGSLTSVTIPNSVTSIGFGAFHTCTSLTSVTIGSGVTSIGDNAFQECSSLMSMTFSQSTAPAVVGSGWIVNTPDGIRGHAYASSNFPPPGGVWNGLIMGEVVAAKPGTPTGVVAIPGNAQVTLNWTAPSSNGGSAITGYSIYRGTTSGTETLLITLGNAISYSNIGLTNGQTYYYKVSAINSVGEGLVSNEVTAMPMNPDVVPSAPTLISATPGNKTVTLTWTAPSVNGGSAIDYYVVYQDGVALVDHQVGLTAVVTGLINGHDYGFTIAAHSMAGTGAPSNAVSSVPYTVADVPTGLKGALGNGQVTLNWTAPAFDGGRTVDYYVVYQDGEALPYQLTGPTTIITGLVNGRAYSFTISAHNLAGVGAQTTAVTITPSPAPTVPGAPTDLSATPKSGQVSLSWSAPSSNGGGSIDHYIVYQNGTEIAQPTSTDAVVSGLTNGVSYTFTVAAHNAAGKGSQSSSVSATPVALTTVITVPGSPGGLTAIPGNAQVALSWSAPVSDGGAAIDHYVVYRDGTEVQQSTGTSATITGLTNGQSYDFSVAANNSEGTGSRSSGVSATPSITPTVPGIPNGLTATSGNSQVSLTWTAPSNNGGANIDYYLVYVNGTVRSDQYPTTSAAIAGLTNGQQYGFSIAAHNSVGEGEKSPTTNATPSSAPTVPGVPTGHSVTSGNAQATLSWTAPTSNGGASIDHYIVYQDGIDLSHPTATSITITNLTNGQSYSYTVAAHNSIGTGDKTSALLAHPVSGVEVPGVPTGLIAIAGNGTVSLAWAAPSSNSSMDYYIIYKDGVEVDHTSATSAIVTGLINGQNYSFAVAAHNSGGVGNLSSAKIVSPSASISTPSATSPGDDGAIYVVGVLALIAAIIAMVFVVRRKKKGA